MNLTFYKKGSHKHFTILIQKRIKNSLLMNENGESIGVKEQEIENVIYEAMEKYFKENY